MASYSTGRLRFVDTHEEPLDDCMRAFGDFEKIPLVSLEKAVETLENFIPDIQNYVYDVKQRCKKPADNLTPDESASIMLYTMQFSPEEQPIYYMLNEILREQNRSKIRPWRPYLRLFLNALSRLQSVDTVVYRCISMNLCSSYEYEKTITWWNFSSCTEKVAVLNMIGGYYNKGNRTIFIVECQSGRKICNHSFYQEQDEVLLLAASKFEVISSLRLDELTMIHLKEVSRKDPLLKQSLIIGSLPEPSPTKGL